jgi:hypothetical protein
MRGSLEREQAIIPVVEYLVAVSALQLLQRSPMILLRDSLIE